MFDVKMALHVLFIGLFFATVCECRTETNYGNENEPPAYVFYGEEGKSSSDEDRYEQQQHDNSETKRKRSEDEAEKPINTFSSYLKTKYAPKAAPIQSGSDETSCKGDDSRCEDKSYRVCSGDGSPTLTPSCVDKQTMGKLLRTGHILAGNTYQGFYYDCRCIKTSVGDGIAETQRDHPKENQEGELDSQTHSSPDPPKPSSPPPPKPSPPAPTPPPPSSNVILTLIKLVCPNYESVPANGQANVDDDTGGHYAALNATYQKIVVSPLTDVPLACVPTGGQNFSLTVGATTKNYTTAANGYVDVQLQNSFLAAVKCNEQGDGLRVKEILKNTSSYTFGQLRCYKDVLNGDNLEIIHAVPDTVHQIYCIAYNVKIPIVVIPQPQPHPPPQPQPQPQPMPPPPHQTPTLPDTVLDDVRVTRNTTCSVVKKTAGKYTMKVSIEMENGLPSAAVIGLNPYNNNIKKRGSCDNRKSNLTATWNSQLWSASSNLNAPKWTIVQVPSVNGNTLVTYSADFTVDDLFGCSGPNGENNLIVGSNQNTVFEGTLYISKIIPTDISNAGAGELVQFDRECSFQIHQAGKGIDTICYRYMDTSVNINMRWLLSLCTESGKIAFSMRTCVEKNKNDGGHDDDMYLYSPKILGTANAPNGTFSIASLGDPNACKFENADLCCQDWFIKGLTDDAEPPFVGAVDVAWKYGKGIGQPEAEDVSNVFVTINAFVLDACDSFNDIVVNDTLEGHVELFRDPNFRDHYDCCTGAPVMDHHRVYAALVLAIDASLCDEFVGLIINVTLVYRRPSEEGGGILEKVTIYDVNNPGLLASLNYDVIVETNPGETCIPKISWLAIKKAGGDSKVDVIIAWNATHVPFPNNYPLVTEAGAVSLKEGGGGEGEENLSVDTSKFNFNGIRQTGKAFVSSSSRFAPSVRAPVRDSAVLHYGTHSKNIEENKHVTFYYKHFTNKFAIYKEDNYARTNRSDVKKNTEKIASLAESTQFVRFRFIDKIETKNVQIGCSEFSEWHEEEGECSRGDFMHWFPGARDHPNQRGWVLAIVVFLLVLSCLPFLFCLCSSHHHHHHEHNHLLHQIHKNEGQHQHQHQHQHYHQQTTEVRYPPPMNNEPTRRSAVGYTNPNGSHVSYM